MGYYAAKFKREAKQKPCDWLIRPIHGGRGFELVYIGDGDERRG